MDLNAAIDIIIKDLNDARDIIDDLKKYQGIPVLQVELARSKCRSAAELIALLKDRQDLHGTAKEEQVIKEESVLEITQGKNITPLAAVNLEETKAVQSTEVIQKEVIGTPVADMITVRKEEARPNGRKPFESATIADQFSNRPASYNEQLGGQKHDDDVLEKLMTKPVTDLSEAIGLNDKFLFIREIFHGNQETYNQTISKLDKVQNLQDANEIIIGLSGEDTDAEALRQLVDLVKRKFPSYE